MIEFTQISKLMVSKGLPVTADRCASKMKSMRERFHEINEKAKEEVSTTTNMQIPRKEKRQNKETFKVVSISNTCVAYLC